MLFNNQELEDFYMLLDKKIYDLLENKENYNPNDIYNCMINLLIKITLYTANNFGTINNKFTLAEILDEVIEGFNQESKRIEEAIKSKKFSS